MIATASAIGKRLGKVGIVVGNCFGFVGNRMLSQRTDAAERLLLDGASPQEVDGALTDFGFRMGPFAMADLAGLDIGMRIRKAFGKRAPVADAIWRPGATARRPAAATMSMTGRKATPDPAVDAIIAAEAEKLGITRRPIAQQEIIERLVYPMINEGARILEEGIAERPGDIDAIWLHGYNWPAWRGGPMFYADLVGLRAHPRPPGGLRRRDRRPVAAAGAAAEPPRRGGAGLRRCRGEARRVSYASSPSASWSGSTDIHAAVCKPAACAWRWLGRMDGGSVRP